MRIHWIKFKVSTKNDFKCSNFNCKDYNYINGKKGFVKIKIRKYYGDDCVVNLCLDCFDEFVEKINKDRKQRSRLYNKLVNTLLLRGLK